MRDIQSSFAIENGEDSEEKEVTEEEEEEKSPKSNRKGGRGRKKQSMRLNYPLTRSSLMKPSKRDLKSGLSVVLMEELINRLYEFKEDANDVLEEFLTFEGMWSGRS